MFSYDIAVFVQEMLLSPPCRILDSKVRGTNMGPAWVLSAPDGPNVGPMNLVGRMHYHAILYRTISKVYNALKLRELATCTSKIMIEICRYICRCLLFYSCNHWLRQWYGTWSEVKISHYLNHYWHQRIKLTGYISTGVKQCTFH